MRERLFTGGILLEYFRLKVQESPGKVFVVDDLKEELAPVSDNNYVEVEVVRYYIPEDYNDVTFSF